MKKNKRLALELQNALIILKKTNALRPDHPRLRGAERHILLLVGTLKNGQPVTISEIANTMGTTLAAVMHQTNALEKQGLIKRISHSKDGRIAPIALNKRGKAQLAGLRKKFLKKIQILVDFLGEKDSKDLIRLIKKISEFPASANRNNA